MPDIDEVPVVADRVPGWLLDTVPEVPASAWSRIVGVSLRTWRRWGTGEARPRPANATRLGALAACVAQLRHGYSPDGTTAWFTRRHPQLDDRRPVDLLGDAAAQDRLVDAAAGARESVAS